MKICVSLMLLTLLCPGGCPVYDFNLKTVEQPSYFANDLKLAADLNSEYEQGLMNLNAHKDQPGNDPAGDGTAEVAGAENEEGPSTKLLRDISEEDTSSEVENFVGSNLFDGNRKQCFSPEDTALLTARKDFELLIPKDLPKCLLTDDMLGVLLTYFYGGNQLVQKMPETSKNVVEKAYYDVLGGYLRSYLLPVAKFSFYAGQISLKSVNNVVSLYEQCKAFLNTNGNGWKEPITLDEMKSVRIAPLKLPSCDKDSGAPSGCSRLELSESCASGEEEPMIVALPKLEDCEPGLGNIWLPFKRRHNFDLRSPKSAFVIVRFYETVTRCYKSQSLCQTTFNHKFKSWINENIQPHLSDEQFYPGLGAVLRIFEKLRKGRKALDIGDRHISGYAEEEVLTPNEPLENSENQSDGEGFSDLELASKALEYKMQEKDRQVYRDGENWFRNYRKQMQSRKTCEKSTHKPKCKSKGKTGSGSPIIPLAAEEQRHYIKYVCCMVALILFVLLMILLVAFCIKCRKPRNDKPKDPSKPKKKHRFKRLVDRLLCRKKPADEEILIKPDTKSVIATQPQRRSSSSTSSLACQPTSKCIPCSKRSGKDSESAPVIETTSLDYSSSEPENKFKKKKAKPKVVTIDEKNKSPEPSPRKKRFGAKSKTAESTSNESKESKGNKKFGLGFSKSSSETGSRQKGGEERSQQSHSWETMYES